MTYRTDIWNSSSYLLTYRNASTLGTKDCTESLADFLIAVEIPVHTGFELRIISVCNAPYIIRLLY